MPFLKKRKAPQQSDPEEDDTQESALPITKSAKKSKVISIDENKVSGRPRSLRSEDVQVVGSFIKRSKVAKNKTFAARAEESTDEVEDSDEPVEKKKSRKRKSLFDGDVDFEATTEEDDENESDAPKAKELKKAKKVESDDNDESEEEEEPTTSKKAKKTKNVKAVVESESEVSENEEASVTSTSKARKGGKRVTKVLIKKTTKKVGSEDDEGSEEEEAPKRNGNKVMRGRPRKDVAAPRPRPQVKENGERALRSEDIQIIEIVNIAPKRVFRKIYTYRKKPKKVEEEPAKKKGRKLAKKSVPAKVSVPPAKKDEKKSLSTKRRLFT